MRMQNAVSTATVSKLEGERRLTTHPGLDRMLVKWASLGTATSTLSEASRTVPQEGLWKTHLTRELQATLLWSYLCVPSGEIYAGISPPHQPSHALLGSHDFPAAEDL
jgi:hypothetical protein